MVQVGAIGLTVNDKKTHTIYRTNGRIYFGHFVEKKFITHFSADKDNFQISNDQDKEYM